MFTAGSRVRRHAWIKGRVQGVNFRNSARRMADELGVTGWVKNLEDGRVEAVFEGTPDSVDRMLVWCRHGPPGARVMEIEVASESPTGEYLRFQVHR